ncbi:MAG: DUF2806 domain-containing protein [Oscillospiraceae bacterium]|nr:DUF2806 domain-containing protein [Oscillospiraceae bacterium]
MSDLKGIDVHDIFGLSEPLTKLIETVAAGIGRVFDPIHDKRMTNAKVYEIEQISEAVENNLLLPTSYRNGDVEIDTTDANDLIRRAGNRLLFQELKKQRNIDAVIAAAYTELESETIVSQEPVDDDWISSFFDFIANVSSKEMQMIWGKLLAGEIKSPRSYSIRTLDVLRKMTALEAGIFQNLVPYVLRCWKDNSKLSEDYFVFSNVSLDKYGIPFPSLVALADAGLLTLSQVYCGLEIEPNDEERIWNIDKSMAILVKNTSEEHKMYGNGIFAFSEAGEQLLNVALSMDHEETPLSYIEDVKDTIIQKSYVSYFAKADLNGFEFSVSNS